MVAIVTGNGHGLERSSLALLGSAGSLGNAQLGRGGQNVYVNAATGTLNVQRQDEFLVGRGPDQNLATEFSTGHPFWHSPNWRAIFPTGLTGTVNTAGSTITRSTSFNDWPVYTYDVERGAYINKEGGGAHDEVRFENGVWSFTDGNTRTVEYYEQTFYSYMLVSRIVDADGNTQTYTYDSTGGCIARITNADGSFTEMTNTNWRPNEIKSSYLNAAGGTSTMTRVRYNWDPANTARLLSLTVDLTPEDNSIADGNLYRIEYGYTGSTQRLTSISQTDGSRLDIVYDANGRVQTLTETVSAGVTRITSLSYDTANRVTTVTDAAGQATQLWYDAQQRLTKIVSPPATTGAAAQTQLFAYDADGNVTSTTDPAGNVTTFQYDANGNEIRRQDSLGQVVTRTYGARNELLTETVHPGSALTFATSAAAPTVTGNTLIGTSGSGAWGSATSHQTYTGSAVVSGRRLHNGNGYSFLGLTDAPLSSSAPYNEFDYAFYFHESNIRIWENGVDISVPVVGTASNDHFCQIEYDGAKVIYRINGAVVREVAASGGRTFHAGVSTSYPSSGVQDVIFGTSGSTSTFATSAAAPTINGDKFIGTSGSGAWGSATSHQTYTGSAVVSGRRLHNGNGYSFLGLTDAPLSSSAPYNEFDYAFYFHESNIRIWENGVDISVPVVGTASNDHFCQIEYDGAKVIYRINGAVVREVAASGGRTFHAGVSTSYPSSGVQDLTFVSSPPLTARYAYDSENHLRYAINAQGEVTEYRYNAGGQRVAELVYADDSYNVSGLPSGQPIAEATMNGWVSALADKSSVKRTNTYYDARGQVSSVVSYSALSKSGEGAGSPLAITPGANTTVEQQAGGHFRITKTSGAAYGWDADAHSSMKVEGDFVLRLRPGQGNRNVVAGLAKKPGGSASYTNLDYGFYFTEQGPLYYMEQGVYQYLGVYYTASDNLWIARTGTTISYYKGATFDAAVAAGALRTRTGASETLYFDSSFHEAGAVLDVELSPRGVVSGWNTTVTPQADGLYRITKTAGSTASWDGDARGTAKAEGDFVLQLQPRQTNAHVVAGVSTAPHAHADYENVEFGFYFTPSGEVYRTESGYYTLIANYALGDKFWLVRSGSTINYYKGATLEAAVAAGTLRTRTDIGGTFYFDSSFHSTGSSLDMAFTPALLGGWNTSVAPVGDGLQRITKTGGSTASWDAHAVSTAKADGDFVLRLRPGQTSAHVVGGVSTVPDANADYENVEFGFFFSTDGGAYRTESGYYALLANYVAGDNFWLVRTGTTINYYKGATLEAAMAAGTLRTRTGIGGTFYFDSSFYSTGAVMDVAFAPAPTPAASARYSRTDFAYDQAGQLIARITEGQRPETFVYDGLGRVVAATDRNQGTTSIVFNDAATQTVVTLASGLVTTSTYNKAGDLVSVAETGSQVPGGTATTTSKYDKLGRLRMTTDATGFNRYFVYDKAGRLVGEVNHRGDLVEYRYDSNDRLVATARYWNGVTGANLAVLADPNSAPEMSTLRPSWHPWDIWNWRTYDKEGRLTSTMDGTIRTYEYDPSGRLVKTVAYHNALTWDHAQAFQANPPTVPFIPAADPRDSVTRNFYDKAGRLVAALDGEGYLTRNVYDRAGRLVERIAYATASAAADRTRSLSRLIASQASHADDRRTRFAYDGQGQLRFEVDALNQVTEYRYNAAGQATSTIRHAGSIPAPADYRLATIEPLVATLSTAPGAAASRRSWSVHDEAGRVAYAIGAEGAVTRFSYDNRGQVTKTVEFAAPRATTTAPDLTAMNAWANAQAGNAANRVTRHYYSARGELRYSVDGEGYVSRTDFDAAGRVTGEFRWDDPFAINDSSTIGNVAAATDNSTRWGGNWYAYEYGGPLTDWRNGEYNWTRYDYYQNGTQMREYAPYGGGAITYFDYDMWGRLYRRTDANGMPEGATVAYGRDGLGNQNIVVDGRNHTTTRTFDRLGRVRTETDAANGVVTYEYNAFGEVTKVIDARGNATTSTYDKLGRLLATTDALNNVTSYSYDEFGDLRTVTRGAAVTSFTYDRAGRVTRTTDAEGHYEEYTLDVFGNRINVRNKIGGNIVNAYDRRGLLVAETLPMASVDSNGTTVAATVTNRFEYDGRRNRTRRIEAFGLAEQRTTTYYYDRADRLIETGGDYVQAIDQAGHNSLTWVIPTERLKYDERGLVIERTDALGARTLYYYDGMKRLSVELGASGTYTAFTYDANGNVLTRRVYGTAVALPGTPGGAPPAAPGGEYRETRYSYDALNRLKTTSVSAIRTGAWNGSAYATDPYATVTTTLDYDANGNVVRSVDGNNASSFAYYDKENRKIAEVDREGYLTFYTLDAEGNVTREDRYAAAVGGAAIGSDPHALRAAVAGGGARTTLFEYDRNGRRRFERRTGVEAYALNGDGTLAGLGYATASIEYAYNGLGEVTRKTEANGDAVDYDYDLAGRLTRERRAAYADQTGAAVRPTLSYSYNGINALTRTRQGGETAAAGDRITRYTYGAGGRMASMTDANGATYDYYYDAAGNVLRENYYRYRASGYATIDALLYTRDQLGRVTSQGLAAWNGSAWDKGDIQKTAYNVYGDVAQRGVNDLWQEQLTYDSAGRLVKSNSGDGVWRFFAYDGAGNRTLTLESEGGDYSAYTLDQAIGATNAGNAYVDGIVATIGQFDRRGQQVATRMPSRELGGGLVQTLSSTRAYNAYGEVTSETDALNNTSYFAYNAMGRMTEKQAPAVNFTTAGGQTHNGPPVEKYYYEISGRMIGLRDANSVYENHSNPNHKAVTRALLAGTGHGGSEALVTAEYHPDGGVFRTQYDVFGDARILWDELNWGELRSYDAMGRLVQQTHRGHLLTDYYGYDLLGQRTSHWNSVLGSGHVEVTDYDVQGRVTSQSTFGSAATTYSYSWNGSITTSGMGNFGGWTKTIGNPTGYTSYETTDLFGRTVSKSDQSSRAYYFNYDTAGRLTSQTGWGGQSQSTSYFNTGRAYQIVDTPGVGYGVTATFGYDAAGNRTYEGYWSPSAGTLQHATIEYDSHGRMIDFKDRDAAGTILRRFTNQYDLAGNIRRSTALFPNLAHPHHGNQSTEHWFAYDSMNRMTVANGQLLDGSIVAGSGGVALTYDAAGRRRSATQQASLVGYAQVWVEDPGDGGGWQYEEPIEVDGGEGGHWETRQSNYMGLRREDYEYRADGYLMNVYFAEEGYYDSGNGYAVNNGVIGASTLRASNARDNLGRVTRYYEIGTLGDVAYDRYAIAYDAASRVTSEVLSQKRLEGAWHTYTTTTSNQYNGYGGALSYSSASTHNSWSGGSSTTNSWTSYYYGLWDDARVSSSTHNAGTGQGNFTSTYSYDGLGRLASVNIADGRPRTVTFTHSPTGQVLSRIESSAASANPADYYYFVDGVQVGELTNNGLIDLTRATYSETFVSRNWNFNQNLTSRPFRWNTATGVTRGQFGGSGYDPVSPTSQGMEGTDSRYQVREGDTLQGIAASLWGDSSLWYMIAEANGLSGNQGLPAGTSLIIPDKVTNIRNSARTFEVYDPNRALGDLSPTAAKPQKKANKCGVFGMILLVAVAVAVSVVTAGAAAAIAAPGLSLAQGIGVALGGSALLGATTVSATAFGMAVFGAVGAAAGSIVSQGLGVATGLQDKFSWKSVAMAGISGGIGGGLGSVIKGAGFVAGAARGALGSAASQGVGVAIGLQKKFDFVGVAAAAVSGGVGAWTGNRLQAIPGMNRYGAQMLSGTASAIANAATRSAIQGTNFGDNILAALPDVIGSTLGNMIADGVAGSYEEPEGPEAEVEADSIATDGDGFIDISEEFDSGVLLNAYLPAASVGDDGDLHQAQLVYWDGEAAPGVILASTPRILRPTDPLLRAEVDREWAALTPDERAAFLEMRKRGGYDEHALVHQFLYDRDRLPGQISAAELMAFMPGASRANAQRYARPLSDAMARNGIISVEQRAAFLSQVAVETGQLRLLSEDLSYRSVASLRRQWPRRFRGMTDAQVQTYVRNPQDLANLVYGGRIGNTQPGDGYRYRGRGFLQVTGRANYRARGFENNPAALADPEMGAFASAGWWQSRGMNARTANALTYAQFRGVVRTVNGGYTHVQERWGYYQQALRVIRSRR